MARKKASTDGNEADAPSGLTGNEMRFIKAVFDNMTQKPDADWSGVASDLGLKDAKCAKERFRQMSVRHGWGEQSAASPRKRGAAAAAVDEARVVKKRRMPPKKEGRRESGGGETDDECEI